MKNFIGFLLLFVITFVISKAEIIYTDLNPDVVLKGTLDNHWDILDIDLDHDGTIDMEITHFYPSDDEYYTESSKNNFGEGEILVDDNNKPLALVYGEKIDGSKSKWIGFTTTAIHIRDNWRGAIDKYLGIRIMKNGNWHYCWIRMDIPENESNCTVKDFAFNNIPGAEIKAGESNSTDVINIESSDINNNFSVYLIGRQLQIISENNYSEKIYISLYDVYGRNLLINQSINLKESIYLSNYFKGIYFVVITNNRQTFIKKICI